MALATPPLQGLSSMKAVAGVLFKTIYSGTWHRVGALQVKMKEQIIGLMDNTFTIQSLIRLIKLVWIYSLSRSIHQRRIRQINFVI